MGVSNVDYESMRLSRDRWRAKYEALEETNERWHEENKEAIAALTGEAFEVTGEASLAALRASFAAGVDEKAKITAEVKAAKFWSEGFENNALKSPHDLLAEQVEALGLRVANLEGWAQYSPGYNYEVKQNEV